MDSMASKKYNNLVAFPVPSGEILAFHSSKLELAKISLDAWNSLSQTPIEDLRTWDLEQNVSLGKEVNRYKIKSININVTQICNLHCAYCAAAGDGTYGNPVKKISIEKTIPQLQWFFNKLAPGESFSITMLGGEPLLYPQGIALIAEYATQEANKKNINLNLRVVTNGTLFTKENVKILNKYGISVTLSMDGPAETNDLVRKSNSGISTTQSIVEGLKVLFSNRDNINSIGVRGVFGAHNTDVVKAYEFYAQYPFNYFEFSFDVSCKNDSVSDSFTRGMMDLFAKVSVLGEAELRKIRFIDTVFEQMDNQTRNENHCGSGKTFAVIDSANQIFKCPWEVSDPHLKVNQLSESQLQTIEKTLIEEKQLPKLLGQISLWRWLHVCPPTNYRQQKPTRPDLLQ